jgi:hypothetical protein
LLLNALLGVCVVGNLLVDVLGLPELAERTSANGPWLLVDDDLGEGDC